MMNLPIAIGLGLFIYFIIVMILTIMAHPMIDCTELRISNNVIPELYGEQFIRKIYFRIQLTAICGAIVTTLMFL